MLKMATRSESHVRSIKTRHVANPAFNQSERASMRHQSVFLRSRVPQPSFRAQGLQSHRSGATREKDVGYILRVDMA